MSEESPFSPERLSSMIRGLCVENRGEIGYSRNGNEELIRRILDLGNVGSLTGLSKTGWEEKGFTRLVSVPLSSPAIDKGTPSGFDPKDVALCFSFWGRRGDSVGRDGLYRAVIVVSQDDSQKFIEAAKAHPELVYNLLRVANGGHVRRFDGTPLDIKPGKAVEILANENVGGIMKQKVESIPFQAGFNPNPLF